MMEKDLQTLQSFLHGRGFDVSTYDPAFLGKIFARRLAETQSSSEEEYIRFIESSETETEILASSFRVSYSEFFRNPLTFGVLERIILPSLVLQKKNGRINELRIWSAACAGGQESYSLTMLLEELKKGKDARFTYRVFNTDHSGEQVKKAAAGIYPVTAISNLSFRRIGQWFEKTGDSYVISETLKRNMGFAVFDMLDPLLSSPPASIFGDFDIVFCANLLFYYRPEFRKVILAKAGKALAKGGYLVVGETEREIVLKYNFSEVLPHSAIFQLKR